MTGKGFDSQGDSLLEAFETREAGETYAGRLAFMIAVCCVVVIIAFSWLLDPAIT